MEAVTLINTSGCACFREQSYPTERKILIGNDCRSGEITSNKQGVSIRPTTLGYFKRAVLFVSAAGLIMGGIVSGRYLLSKGSSGRKLLATHAGNAIDWKERDFNGNATPVSRTATTLQHNLDEIQHRYEQSQIQWFKERVDKLTNDKGFPEFFVLFDGSAESLKKAVPRLHKRDNRRFMLDFGFQRGLHFCLDKFKEMLRDGYSGKLPCFSVVKPTPTAEERTRGPKLRLPDNPFRYGG